MTISNSFLSGAILLGLMATSAARACAQTPASENDRETIYRYDPVREILVPIDETDLKPDHVYSHYSDRLGRRVWSYLKSDRTFWYAFGETTTIEGWRFDVAATEEQIERELQEFNPRLAEQYQRRIRPIRFTLDADNQWVSSGTSRVLSVYNAETGHRWENLGPRFVPVRSSWGYRWSYQSGKFTPLTAYHAGHH